MIPRLFESAHHVGDVTSKLGFGYCIIGGVALQRCGPLRATLDVDLPVLVDSAASFAVMHRVVLARYSFGTPVDITLGAMSFEARSVLRASEILVGEEDASSRLDTN